MKAEGSFSHWYASLVGAWPFVLMVGVSLVLLVVITPEALVEWVGLENAYVLMFVTALLGGLTTFNTVPYLSMLLLLASGGLNPFLLGLASACGVMGGDTLSYMVGYQGARVIPSALRSVFERIYTVAEKHPQRFPLVCFLYGALCPLSNDFITIPAGMARITYVRVMVPLALGNLVFNIGMALFASTIYEYVAQFV
ncbi:MAG: VTT domain-containing protein [Candidatus Pacebacteria bacterium]|nr:VTT domain-containing protein [Candidatus Paceibacterota bacterium]